MPSLEYIGVKLALAGVQPALHNVNSLLEKEIGHVWKVDDKLRELQATYIRTQALLHQLDSSQIHETTLEPWLHDLERYCYDIEDIVDDLVLSLPLTMEEDESRVRRYIFKSLRLTIPRQIADLQKKLQYLEQLIRNLISVGAITSAQPQTDGVLSAVLPYGKSVLLDKTPLVPGTSRDTDKQLIVSELISHQIKSGGVSIIGMDGLGKTSLARTILVDERIVQHLPLVLSASVSGQFQIEDVVQKLARDHSRGRDTQFDQSHGILQELLCSSTCLIVLDDLWGVTDEDWDYFKCNYLSLCASWKILTTTRNPKVAEVTESNSIYLNRMTDEDCRKLIVHRANLSKFECESWSEDLEIIAKKCMGMPILANKIGLKLSKKQMGAERKNSVIQFKMDKLWELHEFSLNEPKLPPDLKRCFAYCSLFPAGYEFKKEELLQFWEVEGFIQPQPTESLMQVMNHRFEDLLSRSIFQPSKVRDNKQLVYKMHEFNHEFAHLLASKAFCRLGEGTSNLLSSCKSLRHLSLACHSINGPFWKKIEECEGLRTFLLLHHTKPKKRIISHNFYQKLHRLRLLDLSHTNVSSLPKTMFPSKHLRFLDLSYTKIKKLPESICSFRALQILKLKGCSELLQLPNDLNQLTNLAHLHVDMKNLGFIPSNIGRLTKLEVLDSFYVGREEGLKVSELRSMNRLKEIHMFGLENIVDVTEAQETELLEKSHLRKLALEWDNRPTAEVIHAANILEGLQPHSHLEDLVVRNYQGHKLSTWLVSPLCQLVSIYLENCPNCQVLPSLAQLPLLKNLVFCSLHIVTALDNQFCGEGERVYPCLEVLEFHDMKGLVNWTGLKAGDMPCLRTLKIVNCPVLVDVSSFEHLCCLMSLEINSCPELCALPKLPSSLNGDFGELILIYSPQVTKRCEFAGADWPKIKEISYVEIDASRILTKLATQSQNGQLSLDVNKSKSKGKQKVDEGTSSNIVTHVAITKDWELEDQDHSTSLLADSASAAPTTSAAKFLKPTKVESLQVVKGQEKPSKRSSSRHSLRRCLLGCFSMTK